MYEGNEPSPSRLRITYYHSVLSMQAWSPLGNPSLSTAINVDVELLAEIDCNNWTWHQAKQAGGGTGTASGSVLEKEFEALCRKNEKKLI